MTKRNPVVAAMRRAVVLAGLGVLAAGALAAAAESAPAGVSLRTVEGRVVEVRTDVGEGDLDLLAVRLETASVPGSTGDELVVLLAPDAICQEIGFEIEEGDRLRARIFVGDEGPARAQKALNLTRGRMARFRTLRDVPLWSGSGAWHGGPSQMAPGMARGPRRHGGGPPGR